MKKNVTFKNRAINMAGNLYLPNDFSDNKKYAAIVCVHPGSSVKEQTAGIYAGKLAAHGFVTLAFDASYQGESGGEPRYIEEPTARVEDIRSAVDYLTTLEFVDPDRIRCLCRRRLLCKCSHDRASYQSSRYSGRCQYRQNIS